LEDILATSKLKSTLNARKCDNYLRALLNISLSTKKFAEICLNINLVA